MSRRSNHPVSPIIEERVYKVFTNSFKDVKTSEDVISFLNDLLSSAERVMLAKRVAVAFLLIEDKYTYDDISRAIKVSRGTIAKIHAVLILQGKGYRRVLGNMIRNKNLKALLEELSESFSPSPPRGANWKTWYGERRRKRLKRLEVL